MDLFWKLFGGIWLFVGLIFLIIGIAFGDLFGIIFTLTGTVSAAIGVSSLSVGAKRKAEIKKLISQKQYITTNEWQTEYSNFTVNRVKQYCFTAYYTDLSGRKYIFRGKDTFPPSDLYKYNRNLPMRVYVDLQNPNKYFVDYSSVQVTEN